MVLEVVELGVKCCVVREVDSIVQLYSDLELVPRLLDLLMQEYWRSLLGLR